MELPRGSVGILGIQCPVVAKYEKTNRRKLLKAELIHGVQYDSKVKLPQLEKFWILSALEKTNGCITSAAKLLGIGRETVYRRLREYNK